MTTTHDEQTGHMPPSGDRKALIRSGILTGIYFVVELVIGLWTGSVSVTSDAFHTFSAVGGVLIASWRHASAKGLLHANTLSAGVGRKLSAPCSTACS